MTSLEIIKENEKIDFKDYEDIIKVIFESFTIGTAYTDNSYLSEKESLLKEVSSLLLNYYKSSYFDSASKKVEIINLIDKINTQLDLLELIKDNVTKEDLKIAGERLGRKSQSSFGPIEM